MLGLKGRIFLRRLREQRPRRKIQNNQCGFENFWRQKSPQFESLCFGDSSGHIRLSSKVLEIIPLENSNRNINSFIG